jgi:hypothetical protein
VRAAGSGREVDLSLAASEAATSQARAASLASVAEADLAALVRVAELRRPLAPRPLTGVVESGRLSAAANRSCPSGLLRGSRLGFHPVPIRRGRG